MPFIQFVQQLMGNAGNVFASQLQQQRALINLFLRDQENAVIRIYVAAASGLGHQATTILILNRLMAMGFNQRADVIYDDAGGETGPKLKRLIPGFDPAAPQPVVIGNLHICTLVYFNAHPNDFLDTNMGFTGGYDTDATNLANLLKVSFFLKLQPFQWIKQNAIQRNGQQAAAYTILEAQQVLGDATFNNRGYYIPPPAMTEQNYRQLEAAYPAKLAPYQAIINACSTNAAPINLLPVYGIGDFMGVVEAIPEIRPEWVLFYLISAVAYAQDYSDVARLKRPAIIVVIATLTPGPLAALNAYFNGTNVAVPMLNEYVANAGLTLGHRLTIMDFNNAGLNAAIAALQQPANADHILVVNMGSLTLAAFDFMYASSTLPALLEGKGTANLLLNLGLPYFNLVKGNDQVYPTVPLGALTNPMATYSQQRAKSLNLSLASFNQTLLNTGMNPQPANSGFDATSVSWVGKMIWMAYDAGSPLIDYFTGLRDFYNNEQNDKLLLSLLFFLQYVNGLQ